MSRSWNHQSFKIILRSYSRANSRPESLTALVQRPKTNCKPSRLLRPDIYMPEPERCDERGQAVARSRPLERENTERETDERDPDGRDGIGQPVQQGKASC